MPGDIQGCDHNIVSPIEAARSKFVRVICGEPTERLCAQYDRHEGNARGNFAISGHASST